ncbi:hypothetical protein LJ725_13195 [Reyranella aquatilis]|jgi:hypothetical protein|uniref:Uncharacterized protein n=1 Tax=Reyranella aquatilis TaxID=2035356 RepID=A0ABS8KV63_9HYPH|nr:hypothetical protein [Reyranella aquatilis]MCC8429929.1 hypothetical protein [Reyranella aquatilis]
MTFEVLRLAGSLVMAGAVMLTASAAVAGDWKKGRGHKHHHHYYDGEVIVVQPPRPVYYAPRPVVVYPAPVYAPPVAYAPVYGPAYPRGGNLSIGIDVPLR